MKIEELSTRDWDDVWPIVREVVRAEETFPYDPAMSSAQAKQVWIQPEPFRAVVARDHGETLGTANMGPNRAGPGAHIATASFMVASSARGRGVGTALCEYALDWARGGGYDGMQFNAVVELNKAAVKVYERLGFEIVGTVPGAFAHPKAGKVGSHIMFCKF